MSWTTPRTWVVGEVLTAANLNTHVRDNLAWAAGASKLTARVNSTASWTHNGSGSYRSIDFTEEVWDPAGMHSTSSNNHRLTVPTGGDGKWRVGGCVEWDSSTSGTRTLGVQVNSSDSITGHRVRQQNKAVASLRQSVHTITSLAAADYVCLSALQDSGANRTVAVGSGYSPHFWAAWDSV
jgi:hypothetical protein